MNIHRYVIPATIAASSHLALLALFSESDAPPPPPPVEVLLLPPIPKTPEEPITLPPEEKPVSVEQVKPLLGKPAPPELEDVPPSKLPDSAFLMPVDNRPRTIDRSLTELPTTIGVETGVLGGVDPAAVDIWTIDALDGVPRARVQIPPEYPYAMSRDGRSGSVLVEFEVDARGNVVRAVAVRATDREFSEPAVRAVRKWRFEPGRRAGKAVPFRMQIPIEFGLAGS